jgi:hypothetical protein
MRPFPTNNATRIYYVYKKLKSLLLLNRNSSYGMSGEWISKGAYWVYIPGWFAYKSYVSLKHLAIEIMNLKIFLLTLFPHPRSHPPEGRLLWQRWWHRKMPRSTWNFSYFFLIITECNFVSSKEFESWTMQVTSIWHISQFSKYQVQDTSNS